MKAWERRVAVRATRDAEVSAARASCPSPKGVHLLGFVPFPKAVSRSGRPGPGILSLGTVRGATHLTAFLALVAFSCGRSSQVNDAASDAGASGGSGGAAMSGGSGGQSGSGGAAGGHTTGATGGASGAGAEGGLAGKLNSGTIDLEGAPIYTRVQRLTNSQWEHAVTDILRFPSPANLSAGFADAIRGITDFTNNEQVLFVDQRAVVDYESAAEATAALATGTPEALAALYSGTDVTGFVQTLGRRAFRRPLTAEETTKYEEAFALGETIYGAGFANGASFVIRAMLQAPAFLYRSELGPSGEPLTSHEIAAKLSFWLLDTTPSDALLDAADEDALATVEQLEAVAREMLERPAAQTVMQDFHGQLHRLDRYRDIAKVGVPEYDPATNSELSAASVRFFDGIFSRDERLANVFTSTRGFVGPGLASLYGIDPAPSELEERELGSSRPGYFLQVPFLMLYGRNRIPDTIYRGITLLLDVLCGVLPSPSGDIPPIPAASEGQTNREFITEATASCGDCHTVYINPLGFAFEGFDGMGQERSTDNGRPIDASGSYPFIEGTKEFSDARELMGILAESDQVHTCYAKKLTSFALQRDIIEPDLPVLEALARVSQAESIKETIVALVKDPAFRLRAEDSP
jgi:hypothetical protein